jgi:ABC-2 type transport system ATP-binding protein
MADGGIALKDLVVARGGRRVLDGLCLTVAAGEVYALLGANGAGKSTTLFAMLGLAPVMSGTVSAGGRADTESVRAACAYLPENVALYEHLSATENVRYFLALAGIKPSRDDIAEAFKNVRLGEDVWQRRVGAFSKGMRQKTAIALALLRQSPVLLLDEPTSGLDPSAVQDFHATLTALRARKVCVLMVSHDVLGCADIADRIGILAGGAIAEEWRAQSTPPRFDLSALYRAFTGVRAT